MRSRLAPLRPLALAVGMLTVVKVPPQGNATPEDLRRSLALYPLVGAAVGVVPAALLALPLPPLPRAALALAAWIAVTGALHVDGWADCCDAAFAPTRLPPGQMRERRLAILKDPHLGSFGAAGIGLLLLLKASALAYVPLAAPIAAGIVARWSMVFALRTWPPARKDGLAAAFSSDRIPLGGATGIALVLLMLVTGFSADALSVLPATAMGLGAALGFGAFLVRRFGGVTGDVCGAMGELAEVAVLFALLPWTA
ncbi:MAG: cobS [Gemmatimonadetes bacterium]|nr:cobS [Gemmatimonadota bacterium]